MKDNDNRLAWPLVILIFLFVALPISAMAFFRLKNKKEENQPIIVESKTPLPPENEPISATAEIVATDAIDFTDNQEDLKNETE